MSKTIPSLNCPEDITWAQLLLVIVPASILSVVLFVLTVSILIIWRFSLWLWNSSRGISIYSLQHDYYVTKEPINDRSRRTQKD
jgi:hypothetical protein